LSVSHNEESLTMSRGLLEDFKRYSARNMQNQIVGVLQYHLELNIDSTAPGLMLAIKAIEEMPDESYQSNT
jgi:hypothetical protein